MPSKISNDSFTLKAITSELMELKKDVRINSESRECANLVLRCITDFWHSVIHDDAKRMRIIPALKNASLVEKVDDKVVVIADNVIFRLENGRWAKK